MLTKEKQETIIQAAMAEFSIHGYREASTNRIVKAAGIGKGMLFYYFGSKLELYNDLIDVVYNFVDSYFGRLELGVGNDLIEVIHMASRIKMEAMIKNPAAFDFMTRLFLHPEDIGASEETGRRYRRIIDRRDKIMGDMFKSPDTSGLRRDIPPDRLINYMNWCIDGYANALLAKIQALPIEKLSDLDLAPHWADFDRCIEELKTLFYA